MRPVRALITGLLLMVVAHGPHAYGFDLGFAKEDAGQAGSFMDFAASARSLGMGRAHVAATNDAGATYWNPAGLAGLQQKDIVLLYSDLEEDSSFAALSYAQPTVSYGTFGLGVVNLRSSDFKKRDVAGNNLGTFSQNDLGFLLSHGFQLRPRWTVGSSLKVIRQEIDNFDGVGFGADVGLMVQAFSKLKLGLAAHNLLAPKIKLDQKDDEYIRDIRLGAAYQPTSKWVVAADLVQAENRSLKLHLGTEWHLARVLALRTGINETEVSAGLGVKLGDWTLDYAFAFQDAVAGEEDLGNSHRFGFHLSFGPMIREEKTSARIQKKGRGLIRALAKEVDQGSSMDNPQTATLVKDTMEVVRRNGFIKPGDLYQARGYVYYFQGEYEKSVQALSEAIDLKKVNNTSLRRHHAKALAQMSAERTKEIIVFETEKMKEYFNLSKYAESVDSAKKILSFEPQHIEARAYLEDAERHIQEPILRELKIAILNYEQENYLQAMNHLLKVKEMDPSNQEAARYMGHAMAALKKQAVMDLRGKQQPKALQVYEIGRDPGKSQEFYTKGLLYYSQGKLKQAVSNWEKAVQLDDRNSLAKNAYNRALIELDEKK